MPADVLFTATLVTVTGPSVDFLKISRRSTVERLEIFKKSTDGPVTVTTATPAHHCPKAMS